MVKHITQDNNHLNTHIMYLLLTYQSLDNNERTNEATNEVRS